jgi:Zn-dependent protease with chaperone function
MMRVAPIAVLVFFATHPGTADRIVALRKLP